MCKQNKKNKTFIRLVEIITFLFVLTVAFSGCKKTNAAKAQSAKTASVSSGQGGKIEIRSDGGKKQNALADTYWEMSFGQTPGLNYIAHFRTNQTIEAFSKAGDGILVKGTYRYENEKLVISLESWQDIEYIRIDDEFQSSDTYPMQVRDGVYTIIPAEEEVFEKLYEQSLKSEEWQEVKTAFPNYQVDDEEYENNDTIPTGQYLGTWANLDSRAYSRLTLRASQTFYIETNVDHSSQKIITPVSFSGQYVVNKRQYTAEDGSEVYSTKLLLYYDRYLLASYEVYDSGFGDNANWYNYAGE